MLNELKARFQFLKNKSTKHFVKKRLAKRENRRQNLKANFYDLKLNEIVKEKSIFGARSFKVQNLVEENQCPKDIDEYRANKTLDCLNTSLFELKQLKDYASCLSKLILVRSKQKDSSATISTNPKLNEILNLIESQKQSYDLLKKSLKGDSLKFLEKCNILQIKSFDYVLR